MNSCDIIDSYELLMICNWLVVGSKRYVMGDRVSDVDCAAFGVLSQVRWCTPPACPGTQLLQGEATNMLSLVCCLAVFLCGSGNVYRWEMEYKIV